MFRIVLCGALALCGSRFICADAVLDAYNRINDGLIGIRKQFPATQQRVYPLLDQVNKLYELAKSSSSQCSELKKKLQDGQHETKSQLDAAKKTFDIAKTDLAKRFDEQQQRLFALEKQRDQLMAKASVKNDLQAAEEVKKA